MNFGFTEEQDMLRDQVARFMKEACPISAVRELNGSFSEPLWRQVADLGWLGLIIPERFGGVGLKWVDLTVVLEETGRGLCPLPLTSSALAATALMRCGSNAQRQTWLPRIASGAAVFGFGLFDEPSWIHRDAITLAANGSISGAKAFVSDAATATQLMVAVNSGDGPALAIVDAGSVTATPLAVMDTTKPTARVVFDDVAVDDDRFLPMTDDDLTYLADCGAVAVTAEMIGAAEAVLAITSEYAKERIQFGNPIGKYQGVKHRLAEMFVDIESFKSLLYFAAWAADDSPVELPGAISRAKAYASEAVAQIGIDGVGLHGAIGFTAEYDVQLYLKRAKWARPMFGDSDYHYERVAALGGL